MEPRSDRPPTAPPPFFAGGRSVIDEHGDTHLVGQMYVQSHPGSDPDRTPVVLFHGGAQTGYFYEHAPDGGPGFAQLLTDLGRTVYVVDLPGIGRSRYYEPTDGPIVHYSAELVELIFTATSVHSGWPTASLHTQWPGTGQRGDPIFEAFYASQVGRLGDEATAEQNLRAAGAALVDRIGPCFILTHSQSGAAGWHIADARPDDIRGIVALEPKGPPFHDRSVDPAGSVPDRPYGITATPLTYEPALPGDATALPFTSRPDGDGFVHSADPPRTLPNLADKPILVITAEASYHSTYDQDTVDFLATAGIAVDHCRLGDHGIHGNGHLMTLERNRDQITTLVEHWLARHE